jgi:hypothetical protein
MGVESLILRFGLHNCTTPSFSQSKFLRQMIVGHDLVDCEFVWQHEAQCYEVETHVMKSSSANGHDSSTIWESLPHQL